MHHPIQKFSRGLNDAGSANLRYLLMLFLMTGGFFQIARPVLADGTPAGTLINNQATATYEDPNGNTINATSNTVTVTVAEVAGLTATPAGFTDQNGGSVATGDTIAFDFLVTNVGNEATNIRIPGANNLTTQGLNAGTLVVQADLDNNGTYETTIPATGFTTTTSIAAGSAIRVRVSGTVTATSAGDPVSVRLGNTGANANGADTQNQPDDGLEGAAVGTDPIGAADELYTVNATGGAPVNGEREASALNATTLSTASTVRALASVLKTLAIYNPQTPVTTDDLITYRLDLRVASSAPAGSSLTPGTLEGTTITISDGGGAVTRILVSDVIPTGTQFDASFTPTAPAGWQVVYSTTPIAGSTALSATWTLAQPAANSITRIGYVFTGTLAPGSTTTGDSNGFRFRVRTVGFAAGGIVSNIAQTFGETVGDAANTLIFDESGDQNPNNFNDDGTAGAPFAPATDTGAANPATQGTDSANTNAGTGPAGEANVIAISPPGSLLNGPQGQPGAIGPINNQDDFTNLSSLNLPAGSNAAYDPDPITFNNTVQNPPSNTTNLDNVVLRPISPTEASNAVPGSNFGTNANLPNGTTVQITLGAQTATYTFDGTSFNLTAGTPVTIASLTPGTSQGYSTIVNLPAGTAQVNSFPVPIVAFVDNNNDKQFVPASETVFNVTINRAYTGFISLLKESRILAADNATQLEGFTQTPTVQPAPGQVIEYRITYTNISTPNVGSGNAVLNATNLEIREDGTATPNNWAAFTDHITGSATDPGGTITFLLGGTSQPSDPGPTTTGYVDRVNGTIAPGATGNFRFRRRIK